MTWHIIISGVTGNRWESLHTFLSAQGFKIIQSTGDDATWKMIQTHKPDLVLIQVESSAGGPGGRGAPPGGKSSSKTTVTIDINGAQGLQFAIYTPDQAKTWLTDPTVSPVGRGTPYTDTAHDSVTHDLYWAGASKVPGRMFKFP